MTCKKKQVEFVSFDVDDRVVLLEKKMVDRYSRIVCPVNETFLTGMIDVFGKNCSDDIMSYKIGLDMTKELYEYV